MGEQLPFASLVVVAGLEAAGAGSWWVVARTLLRERTLSSPRQLLQGVLARASGPGVRTGSAQVCLERAEDTAQCWRLRGQCSGGAGDSPAAERGGTAEADARGSQRGARELRLPVGRWSRPLRSWVTLVPALNLDSPRRGSSRAASRPLTPRGKCPGSRLGNRFGGSGSRGWSVRGSPQAGGARLPRAPGARFAPEERSGLPAGRLVLRHLGNPFRRALTTKAPSFPEGSVG